MLKKLTVLYDPQIFDLQNYGGISRYFANLITSFNKNEDIQAKLPIVYSGNYYVRNFPRLLNHKIGRRIFKSMRKRIFANLYFAKRQIKKGNYDIFHATYYDPYFLEYLKKPLVVTVHDMIHENYPNLHEDTEKIVHQKRQVIDAADTIIAISEYTKQQIIKYYPNHEQKIQVIYHGLPEYNIKPATEILPKKFLLYIGDRTANYKNFAGLIKAIAPLMVSDPELRLICAGGGAFNDVELNYLTQLGILPQMMQTNAPDPVIKQLYMEALLFIYPSLEEGFGLPMLEAFTNDCAIACSNKSCLPEVGGNAVAYFNPEDIQSIQSTVLELVNNEALRTKYITLGHDQLKKFTFENCLEKTLTCYRSLINNTPPQ